MIEIATGAEALDWHENHGVGQLHVDHPTEPYVGDVNLDEARAALDHGCTIRLKADPRWLRRLERVSDDERHDLWWTILDLVDERAAAPQVLRDVVRDLNDSTDELLLPAALAARFLAWAATLPGWLDGPADQPTPIRCVEVS